MTKTKQKIQLIGIPYDANSSFLKGPALAPQKIREALHCESTNFWSDLGIELKEKGIHRFIDDALLNEFSLQKKGPDFVSIRGEIFLLFSPYQ